MTEKFWAIKICGKIGIAYVRFISMIGPELAHADLHFMRTDC